MIGPKLDAEMAAINASQSEDLKRKLGLDRLRRDLTSGKNEEKKLREACEGFEAVFIDKLWQQMRSNVPQEGYLHSKEEKFYVGMFDKNLSEKLATSGGIGLADLMFNQLHEQLLEGSRSSRAVPKDPSELKPLHPERTPTNPLSAGEGIPLRRKPPLVVESAPATESAPLVAGPETEGVTVDRAEAQLAPKPVHAAPDAAKPASPVMADPAIMARAMSLAARIEYDHVRTAAGQSAQSAGRIAAADGAGVERGTLSWPALGTVTSEFGWRTDPVTGAREWHPGLDIAGREGDPVASCWGGTVVFAGERGRYGNAVVVEHPDGWHSMYAHNSRNLVREGQIVKAGEKIAEMGSTGDAPGTILHFELRQGEQAMNPEKVRETMQAKLPDDDNA
ncbi:Rod binding domain-containing protein [Desulfobaculum xiamenense]|uniref:Rod binding domain-containing protein n=1 Tax=Desulfobaculum xiamenense TaxID=995050 RepID=A0A846QFG7_9BACT|nr:peptidoglycan DD-metalloendopeptidase family protein [Desulfobaculum xiamenense]NJB66981.1 Rod binding domain-containing protein [Desulfobaculum xiamenense]